MAFKEKTSHGWLLQSDVRLAQMFFVFSHLNLWIHTLLGIILVEPTQHSFGFLLIMGRREVADTAQIMCLFVKFS